MGKFNTNNVPAALPVKGRVCLYVDLTTYRQVKALLTYNGSNPSQFFEESAKGYLRDHVLGFAETPKKTKTSKKRVRVVKRRA